MPYTLETNDMRFATPQGFNSGDQFFAYLKDAFDTLYAEGKEGSPKMMSVGLHCRLVGRPGPRRRAEALHRLCAEARQGLDPAPDRDRPHWHRHHKPEAADDRARKTSSRCFGGVFEHSPFIAERAYDAGFVGELRTRRSGSHGAGGDLSGGKPRGAARRVACPSRSRRKTGDCRRTDAGQQEGAGRRRARPAER
jgi:hypothetical protein